MERITNQQYRLDSDWSNQLLCVCKVLPRSAGGGFDQDGCGGHTVFNGELASDLTFSWVVHYWRAASENEVLHSTTLVKRDRFFDSLTIYRRGVLAPCRRAENHRRIGV